MCNMFLNTLRITLCRSKSHVQDHLKHTQDFFMAIHLIWMILNSIRISLKCRISHVYNNLNTLQISLVCKNKISRMILNRLRISVVFSKSHVLDEPRHTSDFHRVQQITSAKWSIKHLGIPWGQANHVCKVAANHMCIIILYTLRIPLGCNKSHVQDVP